MANVYYGKKVRVVLIDALYQASKELDTDGDDSTKSTRLNADQLLSVRDGLIESLKSEKSKVAPIINSLKESSVGTCSLLLQPVQFAALVLYTQDSNYLKLLSYELDVKKQIYDLSSTSLSR